MKVLTLSACLFFTMGAGPVAAEESNPRSDNWQRRFTEASEAVKAGEYKKAERSAKLLLSEMQETIYGGDNAASILATTLAVQALAQAGQGERDDALWSWWQARALDAAVTQSDVSPFGPAAEALRKILSEEDVAAPPRPPKDLAAPRPAPEDVSPPRVRSRKSPVFPAAVSRKCIKGKAVVETIIDSQGRVRTPVVLEAPPVAVMTLAVLETLRKWEFHPAEKAGAPVAVYYVLTVDFQLPGCLPRP